MKIFGHYYAQKNTANYIGFGKAGFTNKGGKGSHRNYKHPKGMCVTISGKLGDDAKPYQEKEVKLKIEESQ